jgi:DNA-binding transcriptional LysR family regulator
MALFVKVAETGSFKQAAEEMNYSNSLISKDISKLEKWSVHVFCIAPPEKFI